MGVRLGSLLPEAFKDFKEIVAQYELLPEQAYEECMFARIIKGVEGENGELLIRFPEGLTRELLPLHRHRFSARSIIVYGGSGEYEFVDEEKRVRYRIAITTGDVVDFPKGLVHTFLPLEKDMVLYAAHKPFQRLDDENILTRERDVFEQYETRNFQSRAEYSESRKR